MMASNVLSKFLPPPNDEPSIYETLRQHDDSADSSVDEEAGPYSAEGNVLEPFRDEEDPEVELSKGQGRENSVQAGNLAGQSRRARQRGGRLEASHMQQGGDDPDDEVPQSLLVEEDRIRPRNAQLRPSGDLPLPVPGPVSPASRAKWQTTQLRQKLHAEDVAAGSHNNIVPPRIKQFRQLDPKEQAAWMWANIENLDRFLGDVYDYYLGHGIRSILLNRCLRLLTLAFVVAFTTFLTSCIDYKVVPQSKKMSQIVIPRCSRNMSVSTNILLWLFVFFWMFKLFDYCRDIRRLRSMQIFYRHLLEIPDSDMQTVSWQDVVKKLMNLRDLNPATAADLTEQHRRFVGSQSKQRMDAHDIANRLMRRENYMIALINKDLLDFTLPLPFLGNRQLFSRTLEWNLQYCILDFVFNEQGQVRSLFLKDSHRKALSDGFRSRFLFAGFISLVCAPFAVLYYMLFFFFRYFTEFQRNPSRIGSRTYTPYALWKFREFNELPHLFERRINMSYPFASRYTDQFPKDKTIQLSNFVAFVAGALASVLAVASLIDPESFLSFELTPERTVLFYLGVFGTIWAVARGNMPEENLVFDPEYALSNVTEYTHYMPKHWKGRLHTNEVRVEFAQMYRMKLVIFLEEILSIILAPYILWFSLPKCSDRLVDFFREFTVHVDGMGYLCSFAVFDFKRGNGTAPQLDSTAARDLRQEYYSTKDGKMLASYYGFIDNYVTNQRPGAPFLHPTNKSSFHAPPAFPGLVSTSLAAEALPSTSKQSDQPRQSRISNAQGNPALAQSTHRRTPHFAPGGSSNTALSSILLDPHHQPSQNSMGRGRKGGQQSRLRASRPPLEHPLEDDENELTDQRPAVQERGSQDAASEGNLGGSWKMAQAGRRTDDDEASDDETEEEATPGVLGLVYQFSKAQNEGRPGVSI